ncbi:neutral zinc metallopeptidase [Hymenobacter tenuis]
MKQFKRALALLTFSTVLATGCQKEIESEVKPVATKQSAQLSAPTLAKPTPNASLVLTTDPQHRDMVLRALALQPTPCSRNTSINLWLNEQLADWSADAFYYADFTAMFDLPTYDAYVFENSSENQYFGVKGEYTQPLTKAFKDLRRFWNIQTSDMVLAAMHGSMLQDRSKIIRTYKAVYGLDDASAAYYADFVLVLLDSFPELREGNHPIFTFNAFALKGFNFPPYGTIPNKIIMGDGIMEAYTAIGFDDVAPQAILAHEFGHQIQFQLNLFGKVSSPEATRRTELMADAYSAYYLSHARGAAMQWKRVQQFLQVFFNIGDCSFTSNGHHGTPTQRMAAAAWGYSIANDAQKQGHILSSQQFTALFEAKLPQLVTQ